MSQSKLIDIYDEEIANIEKSLASIAKLSWYKDIYQCVESFLLGELDLNKARGTFR